jgi:type IV secretory pathway VirB10-like protein
MTEFESARQVDTSDPASQSLRSKGIPGLGTGYDNKINWKGVAFIGLALLIAGLLFFWFRGGFSAKKPAANTVREEVVSIPEAPKKSALIAAAKPPKAPASSPDDYAAKLPDDAALAIELRQKRTGAQFDANGKPIANNQTTGNQPLADADLNKFIYKQYGSNKSISKIGLDLTDPTQSLVKRRAVDSGGVAIYLGGNFLPKGGAATSQFANMESARGVSPGADSAVGGKGEQVPSSGAKGEGASGAGLTGANSGNANSNTNQLISEILNANNRERDLATGKDSPQEGDQKPQQNSRPSGTTAPNKPTESKATSFPASLARGVPINPSLYMAQGTAIRCVMQTMIISDLDGPTMCNVAEDIRSFDSTLVLIPKGSRVVGQYKAQQDLSIDRVAIGVEAGVDNRILDRILPALFISLLSDAFKIAMIKHGPTVTKSTVNTATGAVTVTEQAYDSVTGKNLEKVADQQLASKLNIPARLTVLQGKLINILTAQDLDFSAVYARR